MALTPPLGPRRGSQLFRIGEKVRPGISGGKTHLTEYPRSPSVKHMEIRSAPISTDPIRPFPRKVHERRANRCPA